MQLQNILNSRTTRLNRIHSDTINSCRAGLLYDGSEVLLLVTVKSSILWYTTPYCPVKFYRHFKGLCRKQIAAYCMLHAGLLLGLLFDPEDGGDMFLRNVSWLSPGYKTFYPRKQNSLNLLFLFRDHWVQENLCSADIWLHLTRININIQNLQTPTVWQLDFEVTLYILCCASSNLGNRECEKGDRRCRRRWRKKKIKI
jgi:hypothetical protein